MATNCSEGHHEQAHCRTGICPSRLCARHAGGIRGAGRAASRPRIRGRGGGRPLRHAARQAAADFRGAQVIRMRPAAAAFHLPDGCRGEMTNPFGRGFGDGDPDGTAWPVPGTSRVWGEGPGGRSCSSPCATMPANPIPPSRFQRWSACWSISASQAHAGVRAGAGVLPHRSVRRMDGGPQPPLDPRTGAGKHRSVYGVDDLDRFRHSCRRCPKRPSTKACRSARPARNMRRGSSRPT